MDSIHQAKLKSGYLLHKITLVQSQRNSTVALFGFIMNLVSLTIYLAGSIPKLVMSGLHKSLQPQCRGFLQRYMAF